MSTTVLSCAPEELRAAALGLRRAAAELDATASQVGRAGDDGWRGLAALAQAARRAETASLIRGLGVPVEQVATGLDEVATVAEDAGGRVRRHSRQRDDLALERARLVMSGPASEPLMGQILAGRLASIEEEEHWHQRMVQLAEEEFDEAQRAVAARLRAIDGEVAGVLTDLVVLGRTAVEAAPAGAVAGHVVTLAAIARRRATMKVPGGERTLFRMSLRLEQVRLGVLGARPPKLLLKVPGWGPALGRAASRAGPPLVVVDAAATLVTAGGYEGWRADATRVLAGGAIVGVAVALSPATPVLGAVGVVAVAAYQVWMAGSWVHDNRRQIRSAATRTWSRARAAGSQAREAVDRARGRVRSRVDRLRERLSGTHAPGQAPAGA